MSSESYHESLELLSSSTQDFHRAVTSLIEELDAIDWYNQRAEACTNTELRAILMHNRDEEVEHAMMALEWLRRNHEIFRINIERYIGTEAPITEIEDTAENGSKPARERVSRFVSERPKSSPLGIGKISKVK